MWNYRVRGKEEQAVLHRHSMWFSNSRQPGRAWSVSKNPKNGQVSCAAGKWGIV